MRRWLAGVLAVVVLAIVLGWYLDGGRWYVVRTPSMGTAAPVGTLLWVHPVAADELRAGDLITFRPPGRSDLYSHRVLAVYPDGTLTTKGQLTAPDPWRLTSRDVLGKVEARWWGVGWLIRAAPLLGAALLISLLVTRAVRPERRPAVWLLGASIAVTLVLVVIRPLTGAERLGATDIGRATGSVSYVATGALPVRLESDDVATTLRPGQALTVRPSDGHTDVVISPDFAWWGWVLLVGGCLLPAGATTVRDATSRPRVAGRHTG